MSEQEVTNVDGVDTPGVEPEPELTGREAKMADYRAAPPGCEADGCTNGAVYVVFNKSGRATPFCPLHAVDKLAGAAGWEARSLEG